MKQAGILIRDEEQCREVTKMLRKGGKHFYGECGRRDTECPHIRVIEEGNYISYPDNINNLWDALYYATTNCSIVILADTFLKDPSLIPGWKELKSEPETMIKTRFGQLSLKLIEETLSKHEPFGRIGPTGREECQGCQFRADIAKCLMCIRFHKNQDLEDFYEVEKK